MKGSFGSTHAFGRAGTGVEHGHHSAMPPRSGSGYGSNGHTSGVYGSSESGEGYRNYSGQGGHERSPRFGGQPHNGAPFGHSEHGHIGPGNVAGQNGVGHANSNMASSAHGHPTGMPMARALGGRRHEDEKPAPTPKWTSTEFMAEQNRKQLIGKLPPVWPAVIDKNILS